MYLMIQNINSSVFLTLGDDIDDGDGDDDGDDDGKDEDDAELKSA